MDTETRAMAIVGLGLAQAAFITLNLKGVLPDHEADGFLEKILEPLEKILPANDPGVQRARQLVEEFGRILAAKRTQARKGTQ